MRFIFPQNYSFKNKLFGFIDYSTIFINIIWFLIIFSLLYFLPITFSTKIFIFISLCFPLVLISIVGFNGENIVYIIKYIIIFWIKQKIYFYNSYSSVLINKKKI